MKNKIDDGRKPSGGMTPKEPDDDKGSGCKSRLAMGMTYGTAVGVALGAGLGAAFDNIGIGVGLGICLGAAIGMTFDLKTKG